MNLDDENVPFEAPAPRKSKKKNKKGKKRAKNIRALLEEAIAIIDSKKPATLPALRGEDYTLLDLLGDPDLEFTLYQIRTLPEAEEK